MFTSPECDKLRKDGFCNSQYYSQSPAFSATGLCENVHLDEEKAEKKKKVNLEHKFKHSPSLYISMHAPARKTTLFCLAMQYVMPFITNLTILSSKPCQ